MVSPEKQAAGLAARVNRSNVQIQWFDQQLMQGVEMTTRKRVSFAAQWLRDRIVINISRPVRKIRGGKSKSGKTKTQVDRESRSKPGEFPKADTTRLMKDVFWQKTHGGSTAQVGVTLDYGLYLEVFMDRSFILKTFNQEHAMLSKILGTDAKVKFRG